MVKNSEIDTVYASDDNITFLMEYYYEDNDLKEIAVVGFYYGEPSEEKTREFFISQKKQ